MKSVTEIPALLGSASDLFERDILGHIETLQQSPWPFPPIPDRFIMPAIADTNPQRRSFLIRERLTVSNGAFTGTNLVRLGKGLWRIRVNIDYHANYTTDWSTSSQGYALTLFPNFGQSADLITLFPHSQSTSPHFTFELTVPEDNWIMGTFLGANGVGQVHAVHTNIIGQKHL